MRVQSVSVATAARSQRYYKNTGALYNTYTDVSSTMEAQKWSRSDIVVSKKDATGWRKPLAYSSEMTMGDCGYHEGVGVNNTYYLKSWGSFVRHAVNAPAISVTSTELSGLLPSSNDLEVTLIKALNNVADRKAGFLTSLAEMRSTVAGLGRNAATIDKFLNLAAGKRWVACSRMFGVSPKSKKHDGIVKSIQGTGDTLSSAWLNYWFGLAPIVSDMVAGAAFLSDEAVHHQLRVNGKATSLKNTSSMGSSSNNAYSFPIINWEWRTRVTQVTKVDLWYTIPDTTFRELATYGAVDLASTAWAVVGKSFIVDWVLPVSEILKAYSATVGLTYRGGSATRFVRVKKTPVNAWMANNGSNAAQSFTYALNSVNGHKLIRSIYLTDPKPTGVYLKNPFDVWKAVTAMALLSSWIPKLK